MKFQNPSLNSVLTGRTDGRTDKPKPICSPLFQSWGHNDLHVPTISLHLLTFRSFSAIAYEKSIVIILSHAIK